MFRPNLTLDEANWARSATDPHDKMTNATTSLVSISLRLVATACAWMLASGTAAAQDTGITTKFNGFGTLAGAVTNTDETQFRQSVAISKGTDKSLDIGGDSRLAIQGTVGFTEDFTVTAQVIARRAAYQDFKPALEWMYAQYSGLPGTDLRVGRVVLPAFMVSDSRNVGYAQTALRVPTLVYGMLPVTNLDGAQVNYRHAVGDAVVSAQLSAGRMKDRAATPEGPVTITGDDILSANVLLEWGQWTLRVGQNRMKLNLQFVPRFTDDFRGYGLQYDNGHAVVSAEFVIRKSSPKTIDSEAWYVSGGWRFGKWTPYAVISSFTPKMASFSPGAPFGRIARGQSLGLRHDIAANMAIKIDLSRFDSNAQQVVTRPLPNGRKVNVLSAGLDFVF